MQIRKDFQNLVSPLSDAEFKQLEQSILDEGCRDPLVVWQGFLVDSHNRYAICKKHNIKFQTKEKQFDSEAGVKIWIITNQLARRNLSAYDRSVLVLRMKDVISEKAKGKQKEGGKEKVSQKSVEPIDTQKELAQMADTSHDTINKVEVIEAKATQEQKEQLKKGETTINKIYQDIKKVERGKELEKSVPLPVGKFNLIYLDPPWAYDTDLSKGASRSPENNYSVMDFDELVKFGDKVKKVAHKDCVMFMWTTAPKLDWAIPLIKEWGFKYKTNLIWDKVKPVMGHYSSVRHEMLLIAGKGISAPTCDGKTIQSIDSVQVIEKTSKHSQKPDEFRKIIEKLYPNHTKIELFARGTAPDGWKFWGNEVE